MVDSVKQQIKVRLNRMAGQITGIQKMVKDDQYCVDILTQVASVRAALEGVGSMLAAIHIEQCVYGSEESGEQAEERLEEVRKTLNRFLK